MLLFDRSGGGAGPGKTERERGGGERGGGLVRGGAAAVGPRLRGAAAGGGGAGRGRLRVGVRVRIGGENTDVTRTHAYFTHTHTFFAVGKSSAANVEEKLTEPQSCCAYLQDDDLFGDKKSESGSEGEDAKTSQVAVVHKAAIWSIIQCGHCQKLLQDAFTCSIFISFSRPELFEKCKHCDTKTSTFCCSPKRVLSTLFRCVVAETRCSHVRRALQCRVCLPCRSRRASLTSWPPRSAERRRRNRKRKVSSAASARASCPEFTGAFDLHPTRAVSTQNVAEQGFC